MCACLRSPRSFTPRPGQDLPREEHWLTGLMFGAREEAAWNTTRDPVDFFDLKGAVETLLDGLLIPEVAFIPENLPGYLRSGARIFSGSRELGVLGELRSDIGEGLDLEGDIYVFNLDFAALCQAAAASPLHSPAPLSRGLPGHRPGVAGRGPRRPGGRGPLWVRPSLVGGSPSL